MRFPRSRLRRAAFAAAVGIVLGLLATPAAAAPTMGLSVSTWTRSEPQGLLTYDFTIDSGDLTGADSPCRSYCKYDVSGYFFDGTTYQLIHTFGSDTNGRIYTSLTQRYTSSNAGIGEITHLRAFMWNWLNQKVDSGYVQVATPRTHSLSLNVANWTRNDATGTLTYDFTVTGRNLWTFGSPCRSFCQYAVALYYPDGNTLIDAHLFASSGGWYSYRALDLRFTGTDARIDEGTLLRAYMWDGANRKIDTGYLTVDYPRSPSLLISVDKWLQSSTSVDYDVAVDGLRLWSRDSLCKSYCKYHVHAIRRETAGDVVVADLASNSDWRMYPELRLRRVASAASMGAVTHLRATLVAGSGLTMYAETPVKERVRSGVDVDDAAAILAKLSAQALANICIALAEHPVHTQGTSTSDAYNDCERLRMLGNLLDLVDHIVSKYGASSLYQLLLEAAGETGAEPTPPAVPSPSDPDARPWGEGVDDLLMEALTQRILANSPQRVLAMTRLEAQVAADQCVKQAAISGRASPTVFSLGRHPCMTLPIFLPGSDVSSATQHDYDALFKARSPSGPANPGWLFLNYANGKVKERTVSRNWYTSYNCGTATQADDQCDEYPYFASKQGGPVSPLPSLRMIDHDDNQLEGSRYGTFVGACGLAEAQRFMVIPMVFNGAPPTKATCA